MSADHNESFDCAEPRAERFSLFFPAYRRFVPLCGPQSGQMLSQIKMQNYLRNFSTFFLLFFFARCFHSFVEVALGSPNCLFSLHFFTASGHESKREEEAEIGMAFVTAVKRKVREI